MSFGPSVNSGHVVCCSVIVCSVAAVMYASGAALFGLAGVTTTGS